MTPSKFENQSQRAGSDLHAEDYPLLRKLQSPSPLEEQVRAIFRRSQARRASAVTGVVHVIVMVSAALAFGLSTETGVWQAVTASVVSIGMLGALGQFRSRMIMDRVEGLPQTALGVGGATALGEAAIELTTDLRLGFDQYLALSGTLVLAALASNFAAETIQLRQRRRGWMRSRAVLLGRGQLADELEIELRVRPEYGVDLVGTVPLGEGDLTKSVITALVDNRADRVIVAPLADEIADGPTLVSTVRHVVGLGVPTFVLPRLYEMGVGLDSMSPDRARGFPLVRVQRSAHPAISLRIKRLIDIAVSGLGLLLVSPLLVATAIAVRLSGPGTILFRQQRVGKGGRVFDMLKFRSMASSPIEHQEAASGHRITQVGKVIRATSLDELPQLWNIFRGEMSLVGPRPERVAFVEAGLAMCQDYAERHRMPMGLTGLAQVVGLRGEDTSLAERVKYDNLYIDQWSLGLDFQILLKTAVAVLHQSRFRKLQIELNDALSVVPGYKPSGPSV